MIGQTKQPSSHLCDNKREFGESTYCSPCQGYGACTRLTLVTQKMWLSAVNWSEMEKGERISPPISVFWGRHSPVKPGITIWSICHSDEHNCGTPPTALALRVCYEPHLSTPSVTATILTSGNSPHSTSFGDRQTSNLLQSKVTYFLWSSCIS